MVLFLIHKYFFSKIVNTCLTNILGFDQWMNTYVKTDNWTTEGSKGWNETCIEQREQCNRDAKCINGTSTTAIVETTTPCPCPDNPNFAWGLAR